MKHLLLIIIFAFSSIVAKSQYRYSIENCWEMAKGNYPSIKHLNLIEKSKNYTLANTSELNIPQELSATPTNKSLISKDNTLNILGGGNGAEIINSGSLQANLFILSERVNNIYFSLILINKLLRISELSQLQIIELLRAFEQSKDTRVNNSVNIKGMKVLQEKFLSDFKTLKKMQQMHFEMLSSIVGRKIDDKAILIEPNVNQYLQKATFRGINTSLIDNNKYNPYTSMVNTAPRQSHYNNSNHKLFETAKIDVSSSKKGETYTLDELKRTLLKVNINEQRSSEYTEVTNICLQIEKDRLNIELQREIIEVSYNKIQRGVSDISNLTQGIINYVKTNQDYMSHNVQLMMTANKYNFLFQ